MPSEQVASWLMEHSSVPQTVLKPVALRLGVSTNHLGAALFAGQLVYENQDVIVEYANKGGITVGEFLHERSRKRYGESHPLTRHLRANLDAITEAFEGTEEEALTFAEFYRQYSAVDREYRLTGEIDLPVPRSIRDAMPDLDPLPDSDALPGSDALPDPDALPDLRGRSDEPDSDVVEIPVTDST